VFYFLFKFFFLLSPRSVRLNPFLFYLFFFFLSFLADSTGFGTGTFSTSPFLFYWSFLQLNQVECHFFFSPRSRVPPCPSRLCLPLPPACSPRVDVESGRFEYVVYGCPSPGVLPLRELHLSLFLIFPFFCSHFFLSERTPPPFRPTLSRSPDNSCFPLPFFHAVDRPPIRISFLLCAFEGPTAKRFFSATPPAPKNFGRIVVFLF